MEDPRSGETAGDQGPFLVPPPAGPAAPLDTPPTFSIVICAYEAAATVGDSIRSALEQTHPPHEVIVVDDGSRDDLEEALRPYLDRITLVSKENGGGASALNAGAAVATGEFLAILDSDDTYHPRRLEALAALAVARPDLDLITTDAVFVVGGEEGGRFAEHNPFATEDQRRAIFRSCFPGGWPAVRLSALRRIGGFDESLRTGYDWDCWMRLLLAGSGGGLVDQPFYRYNLRPGSLTASRASSMWDRVRVLEKAESNPALRPEERPDLQRALRGHRSRAVVAQARAALYGGEPRRGLLRLSGTPGIEPRARLLALLSAVAPPLARRLAPGEPDADERATGSGR